MVPARHRVGLFSNKTDVLVLPEMGGMLSAVLAKAEMGTTTDGPHFCKEAALSWQTSLSAVFIANRKLGLDHAG